MLHMKSNFDWASVADYVKNVRGKPTDDESLLILQALQCNEPLEKSFISKNTVH